MPGDAALVVTARVEGPSAEHPRLDVSLTVPPGITAVRGPSGAGKSTLLSAIAGLLRPARGRITLGDHVVFDDSADIEVAAYQRRVALVQQSLALFPHLSALDNVAYGVRAQSRAARRESARRWLSIARIENLGGRATATLSGGEAQRVAIARALASEPRALLLDEPFSALDATLRHTLTLELRALVEELGVPTLFVTHDADDARAIASREVHLQGGRVMTPATGGS
jgi:molybdate transport system ATP-binding protein